MRYTDKISNSHADTVATLKEIGQHPVLDALQRGAEALVRESPTDSRLLLLVEITEIKTELRMAANEAMLQAMIADKFQRKPAAPPFLHVFNDDLNALATILSQHHSIHTMPAPDNGEATAPFQPPEIQQIPYEHTDIQALLTQPNCRNALVTVQKLQEQLAPLMAPPSQREL